MSADKVQEARRKFARAVAQGFTGRATSDEVEAAWQGVVAAVREDEREQAVARFLAIEPWTEESGERIVEAIRNA